MTFRRALGSCIDDLTYAEAAQLFVEHENAAWEHTAAINAQLENVNSARGSAANVAKYNPWSGKNRKGRVPMKDARQAGMYNGGTG